MTLRQIYLRLRSLRHWRRKESELEEEIRFHLSEEADERAAEGASAADAAAAARRDFGNATVVREATRDAWGWAGAERFIQDVRYAFRMVRRHPGFSAVAVLTLALGIGATSAVLNVVSALLLNPLPFPDAERLVVLFATTPKQGVYRDTTSFLDFSAWRSESDVFTDAAAYRVDQFNITGGGVPESVRGVRASEGLLSVLGVNPTIGRAFDAQEQHDQAAVALISHGLWTRRYGSDPRILGRTILLNEVSHAIVGVLPPGFEFLPFQATSILVPIPERTCRSCGYLRGVARLKPGAPIASAQRQLDAIAARRELAFPDSNEGRGVSLVPLQDVVVGPVRTPLLVLLGAGVFVLLIGCGNVGNLVLARGIARQGEFAVRSALGAGSGRLVRQLLTESVSLALLAGLLGAGLAVLGSELLVTTLSQRFPLPAIGFNWTMLVFGLFAAVLSGLLSGLGSAFIVGRADLNGTLKQDGPRQSGGVTQHRLRNLLIVSQTALTVMLLIGAGLLVKSFVRLQRVDIGFDPQHLLTADLLLSKRYADPDQRDAFLAQLMESVRALPGASSAGFQTDSPFEGGGSQETFTIEGRPDPTPQSGHVARANVVGDDFFTAMGIPVVRGRLFDSRDSIGGPPVAVVNETMARHLWPDQELLGQRMRLYYDKDPQRWLTIVGVVPDAWYRYEEAAPQVFLPYAQRPYRSLPYVQEPFLSLVIRTATDPSAMTAAMQARIWAVDKDQPIMNLQPMRQILWQSVAAPRIYSLLLGIFAAIALVIASAGIYGVAAYAVVRRTREIGVRLAIGATPRQILTLVLREGLGLTAIGLALGAGGALALRQVISGFLFGVTPTDGPTFLAVLVLFTAVAALATYLPARRAARIDPTVAFRYE